MRNSIQNRQLKSSQSWLITERERHVLCMIAQGLSSIEIAKSLYLSFETIKSHRKNLMRKLDVPNTAALITAGFKHGILPIN